MFEEIGKKIVLEKEVSEATGTIMWKYLGRDKPVPILWNSYPFHPFRRRKPESNRKPTSQEVQEGIVYVKMIYEIFKPQIICSIGRVGEGILKETFPGMDIRYILKDEDEKLMEISVHIVPAEVLRRAQRGVKDPSPYQELGNNLDKLIVKLIIREIRKRFTFNLKDNFKSFLKSRQVPPFISQLLTMGWINRKGQLLEGASIEDLLTGKYSEQFEQLMPKEVMQEGMHIRETIRTCFEIGQDNDDSLIRNAKKRHALLEITIDETRRKV